MTEWHCYSSELNTDCTVIGGRPRASMRGQRGRGVGRNPVIFFNYINFLSLAGFVVTYLTHSLVTNNN